MGLPATTRADDVGNLSDWSDRFALPVANNAVQCAVEYRGQLYVGGMFRQIGGIEAHGVARWDGRAWYAVGSGIEGFVETLTVYDDQLVAAGSIGRAGGVPVSGVARWNGARWDSMGSGIGGEVLALQTSGGDLIAAGVFDHAGQQRTRAIARWDGLGWHDMAGGLDAGCYALAAGNGTLFAGGAFDSAGGVAASRVARWDGVAWHPLGTGVRSAYDGVVFALTLHNGDVIAGGAFDSAGALPVHNMARWNGAAWDSLAGIPDDIAIRALASWGDTLYVGGSLQSVMRWADGVAFSDPEVVGVPHALAATPEGVVVTGRVARVSLFPRTLLGRDVLIWNGGWHALEPWNTHMRGLTSLSGPASPGPIVYTGGALWLIAQTLFGGSPESWTTLEGLARWDGNTWSSEIPPQINYASALAGTGDTVYVAGRSTFSYPWYQTCPVVARTPSGWVPLDTLSGSVTSMTVWQGTLVAAADHGSVSDVYQWTGSAWRPLGTLSSDQTPAHVSTLGVFDGRLIVGGLFTAVNGAQIDDIAAWDGQQWQPMEGGTAVLRGSAVALAALHGQLWCAGFWDDLGYGRPLAFWDGAAWHTVELPGNVVSALAVYRDHLFVAGQFWDGLRDRSLGVVDSTSWHFVTGDPDRNVSWLSSAPEGLYVGGGFDWLAGRSDYGLALWNGDPEPPVPPTSVRLAAAEPNPFQTGATLRFGLPAAARVTLTVHDLTGAKRVTLANGVFAAGPAAVRWDGRDGHGNAVPPGVYFVRLRVPALGIDQARRVVRVP